MVKSVRTGLGDFPGFGSSLAMAGDVSVVGAGGIDSRAGGAVLRERGANGAWSEGELVIGDHRGPPAILGLDEDAPCTEGQSAGFECENVDVISFLPIKDLAGGRGSMINDMWGWTDPETGHEIAIVGRSDGTAFVDLTDPYNPVVLGDLPKTPGSRSAAWRDMKVHADHVYIVADGAEQHGVQVFDLTRLRDVDGESVTFEPDFLYDGIASAHNIVINEDEGFAYVVGSSGGGETCGGGLHMLDLSEPKNPVFAGCFAHGETGRSGTGYSHDAQCVAYHGPDEDYRGRQICIGSNENSLSIADVTDKDNPVAIAMSGYPAVAYAHQGWLTEDHRFFYMNDEGDEGSGEVEGTRTLIWDVEDLDDPILAAEYIAETEGHRPQPLHPRQPDVPVELRRGTQDPGHHEPHRPRRDRLVQHLTVGLLVEQLPVLRERRGGGDEHERRHLHREEQGAAGPDSIAHRIDRPGCRGVTTGFRARRDAGSVRRPGTFEKT